MNEEKQGWFVKYLATCEGEGRATHVTKVMAFDEAGARDALMRHVDSVLASVMGMHDVKILSVEGGTKR